VMKVSPGVFFSSFRAKSAEAGTQPYLWSRNFTRIGDFDVGITAPANL
jgi:hypothetical protein